MTAQIPSDWHPETYAVDEFNKVVWKQCGSLRMRPTVMLLVLRNTPYQTQQFLARP